VSKIPWLFETLEKRLERTGGYNILIFKIFIYYYYFLLGWIRVVVLEA
jgi:hypothetical protein